MGLFDKKYCDICNEKIGFLGNRKLADGNLCKDCARKLSPFFSDRRESTVEDIRRQLAYREDNKARLAGFFHTREYGCRKKIYVDENMGAFVISSDRDYKDDNPDIIAFSQVVRCNKRVDEEKTERFYEDNEGNEKSYNPPRYDYSYEFYLEISVNSPWFDDITIELSDGQRPESKYSSEYHSLDRQADEVSAVICGRGAEYFNSQSLTNGINNGMQSFQPAATAVDAPPGQSDSAGGWTCVCGYENMSGFCPNCGSKKPTEGCVACGWRPADGTAMPKFCPECGTKL